MEASSENILKDGRLESFTLFWSNFHVLVSKTFHRQHLDSLNTPRAISSLSMSTCSNKLLCCWTLCSKLVGNRRKWRKTWTGEILINATWHNKKRNFSSPPTKNSLTKNSKQFSFRLPFSLKMKLDMLAECERTWKWFWYYYCRMSTEHSKMRLISLNNWRQLTIARLEKKTMRRRFLFSTIMKM